MWVSVANGGKFNKRKWEMLKMHATMHNELTSKYPSGSCKRNGKARKELCMKAPYK